MRWIVFACVALACGDAFAGAPGSEPVPPTDPAVEEPAPRNWRVILASMLGMRGDQGGQIESGYRFVAVAGVTVGPISMNLALDHQLGADNRIPGSEQAPATFSESVASARIGHRLGLGPDFWITGAVGIARVQTTVTLIDSMHDAHAAVLGFDAVATVVWRSGRIASTVVVGATLVPSDHSLVIDGVTFQIPQRVEPWFGLGVALLLF